MHCLLYALRVEGVSLQVRSIDFCFSDFSASIALTRGPTAALVQSTAQS